MRTTTQSLTALSDLRQRALASLTRCGVPAGRLRGDHRSVTPIRGEELAAVGWSAASDVDDAVGRAAGAFLTWRETPASARGALVKRLGETPAAAQGRSCRAGHP